MTTSSLRSATGLAPGLHIDAAGERAEPEVGLHEPLSLALGADALHLAPVSVRRLRLVLLRHDGAPPYSWSATPTAESYWSAQ